MGWIQRKKKAVFWYPERMRLGTPGSRGHSLSTPSIIWDPILLCFLPSLDLSSLVQSCPALFSFALHYPTPAPLPSSALSYPVLLSSAHSWWLLPSPGIYAQICPAQHSHAQSSQLSDPAQLCLVQLTLHNPVHVLLNPAHHVQPAQPSLPDLALPCPTMPWPALSSLVWDYPKPPGSKKSSFLQTYSFFLYNENIVRMNKWPKRRRLRRK